MAADAGRAPSSGENKNDAPRPWIVSLEDVTLTYAGAAEPALRNVSLTVHEGERIAVVGPAGSGKSTLCRLLAGTLHPSDIGSLSGRCLLRRSPRRDGDSCGTSAPEETGRNGFTALEAAGIVSSVPQEPETALVMEYVEDEVAFGPENLGFSAERIEALIPAALSAAGLPGELRSERNDRLSGGQQQRVAIAAALAMEARLIVLDDAAANLDAAGAAQLANALRALHRAGTALVTASPRWDGAEEADRALLLGKDGRILAFDAPHKVLAKHKETMRRLGCLPAEDGAPPALSRNASRSIVLEARSLSYAYPGSARKALRSFSAVIREGDVAALAGPNGTGKTTFGKLAAGLLPAAPDALLLRGRPVASWPLQELAGLVGYVFQRPERQFVADTVLEECAFGLRVRRGGSPHLDDTRRAEEMLRAFGLGEVLAAHPRSLPVGAQRLLNLASALVVGPSLLILDEPTAGLDYAAADHLMSIVADFAAAGGAAIVITHDEYVMRRWTSYRLTLT